MPREDFLVAGLWDFPKEVGKDFLRPIGVYHSLIKEFLRFPIPRDLRKRRRNYWGKAFNSQGIFNPEVNPYYWKAKGSRLAFNQFDI